jgi:Rrf2 family transcriptional regulator, cysteine metabolism repressor
MKSLITVTSKARLGLVLVSELAQHSGELVSLETVAKKAKASKKFLEQVAGELRRAGIVEGVRGATGGYRLTRDAGSITVAEVMNAIEGPMDIGDCTAHSHKTDLGILSKIQGQVMATLMNTNIADIV